ncbi:reverse transcriptase domain-containing protein [Tanacetum coccineum]
MSAMANTTPIVTIVTKPTTKEKTPKDADVTPRVNIQDFCEEHYEDIMPVIMDKIRRYSRKEVHARLDFGESPKKRRIREASQNSSAETLSARYRNPSKRLKVQDRLYTLTTLEVVLIGGTRLTEIVLEAETAPVASKNHMITPAPPMGRGPNMDIARATETAPAMRKEGGKVNPRHPAYRRAAPAMEDTGSQGAARVWFDELPPESIDGYKDLKAAFLAYFMQQKKYVKDVVEIYNIKQRDGETIEEFMERFQVETERIKGTPV